MWGVPQTLCNSSVRHTASIHRSMTSMPIIELQRDL